MTRCFHCQQAVEFCGTWMHITDYNAGGEAVRWRIACQFVPGYLPTVAVPEEAQK